MSRICRECSGSGKLLGGGFCQIICESCHGTGKREDENTSVDSSSKDTSVVSESSDMGNKSSHKIDKRSKAYRDAIDELVGKGLSKEQAVKVFEEEYSKL